MRTYRPGKNALAAALFAALTVATGALSNAAFAQAPTAADPWPGLMNDVFKGRPVDDGTGLIAIDMPARAEDAAIVPVTVRSILAAGDHRRLKAITLIIDQNPAPVAGTFEQGPKAGIMSISTRVRVDSYTSLHAVAELTDGRLHAVNTFVKAAGGCSAPALKNADEARAHIGQMKFRMLPPPTGSADNTIREAQLMIRHPNNSGLQMDQITRLYVPAYFVREFKVWQGDDLVLALDGGISISEDPNVRFTFQSNGAKTFRAEVIDTEDHVFKGEWPADVPRM